MLLVIKIQYFDHFSILISFKGLPIKRGNVNTEHREIRWNTKKAGAWEQYYALTNENKKFQNIMETGKTKSTDEVDKEIQKELTKIKFKTFGKVKPSKPPKESSELFKLKEKKKKFWWRKKKSR